MLELRRRQLDRTHLHKPAPSIIHCDDDRCCGRGGARRSIRCADGETAAACDEATFDLMESRRVECSVPFAVSVRRRLAQEALLSPPAKLVDPSGEHNCYW